MELLVLDVVVFHSSKLTWKPIQRSWPSRNRREEGSPAAAGEVVLIALAELGEGTAVVGTLTTAQLVAVGARALDHALRGLLDGVAALGEGVATPLRGHRAGFAVGPP
jgi:hypothetical protein